MTYEYKVIPAPLRGLKAKGVKTGEERFALALQTAMNEQAADGWEYLRTDTLPNEQREGLLSKTTVYQNMLVFRREKQAMKSNAPTIRSQAALPDNVPPLTAGAERGADKQATGSMEGKTPAVGSAAE
jgi:hypothetical protein